MDGALVGGEVDHGTGQVRDFVLEKKRPSSSVVCQISLKQNWTLTLRKVSMELTSPPIFLVRYIWPTSLGTESKPQEPTMYSPGVK